MFGNLHRCALACLLTATAVLAQDSVDELRSRLRDPNPAVKSAALTELATLGPAADGSVPEIATLLNHSDLSLRHEALLALGQLGPGAAEALPAIVTLLESPEPLLQYQALVTLREIGAPAARFRPAVEKLLESPDRTLAVEAAATTVALAVKAPEKAVATLLQALSDGRPGVRSTAVHWLAASRAELMPQLIELLKSSSTATRISVAELLGELGSTAAPAVESLAALAGETQPSLQAAVARSLGAIGERPDLAGPALEKLADSELPTVRCQALLSIGRFGRRAADRVSLLQSKLKDAEPAVRMAAAEGLASIGPAAAPAAPSLAEALKDAEGAVTIRAAEALGQIGEPAVAILVKTLDDPQYGGLALQTLEGMGSVARSALPRLIELLKQNDKLPARELCLAIAAIGGNSRSVGPVLREIASDPNSTARAAAIYALGRLGDSGALKVITNAIEDDDQRVQLAAAWALVQFDPNNEDYVAIAVPRLIRALSQPEAPIRLEAARTLGQLGRKAAAAQPALVERLASDEIRAVRVASAMALAELGEAAVNAVPTLSELIASRDPMTRRAAMFTLGRIGPPAATAAPKLKELAQSGPVADRALAGWALLQVRGDAVDVQTALPVVLEAIARERPEVVVQLVRVAGRVGRAKPEVRQVIEKLKASDDPALRAAAWSASDQWER